MQRSILKDTRALSVEAADSDFRVRAADLAEEDKVGLAPYFKVTSKEYEV